MNRKQTLTGFASSVGMLILILDGKTALDGAKIGIELCLKTVIPSLFPFFVLSIILTSSLAGTSLPILRPIQLICGLPSGTEAILISGFLGGYPVGAQSIALAFRSGQLEKEDAERLLGFCNNAGPAFLFGMVGSMFPEIRMAWVLWAIHIISALVAGKCIPGKYKEVSPAASTPLSLSQALPAALRVMGVVCGWVILFRVLFSFLQRWILWSLPVTLQTIVTGLLELANGCCQLMSISDVKLRFLICSGMLASGGVCVTMQTSAVTHGLRLRYYWIGKLLQTLFSLILSIFFLYSSWQAGCIATAFLLFPWKLRKKSSIHPVVGV